MKIFNPTLLLMSLGLTLGILLNPYLTIPFNVEIILMIGLGTLSLIWLIDKWLVLPAFIFPLLTFCTFSVLSFYQLQLLQEKNKACGIQELIISKQSHYVQLKILMPLKPTKYQHKYIANVQYVNGEKKCGKILLNIQKEGEGTPIHIDQEILLFSALNSISNPRNPYQFDYQKYMSNLGVTGQISIERSSIITIQNGKTTLGGKADKFRRKLLKGLQKSQLLPRERSILQAMLLGDRKEINPTLYQDYADAGAVHILAVSGLHIGILLMLLNGLLYPLDSIQFGNTIKPIMIIVLLWGYAYLVGLSSSAIRAVTMFSFLAFTKISKRPTHSLNLLLLSYFFTLLFRPFEIYQVGFQMSYLAVFFILWLYPKLTTLIRPRYWMLRKVWQITAVSLTAQLGVAPLSIFYFHQFPGIFLATNIIIMPFLGGILLYGIIVIGLSAIEIHWAGLEQGLQWVLSLLNDWMVWSSDFDVLLFKNVSLPFWKMICLYVIIIIFVQFCFEVPKRLFHAVLGSIVIWLMIDIWENSKKVDSLVVFHKYQNSTIAYTNRQTTTLSLRDTLNVLDKYPIKDYLIATNPMNIAYQDIPAVFRYKDQYYNIIDSTGVYSKWKNTTLILIENPKLNLNRLIDSIQPKMIIADGTNYPFLVHRWRRSCLQKGICFHDTKSQGAFIVKGP